MIRKWLIKFYAPGGVFRDGLELLRRHKPTRWAMARCAAGETYTIEEIAE